MLKRLPFLLPALSLALAAAGAGLPGAAAFHQNIRPILETYCFDCHADGVNKGNVAFDAFKSDQAVLDDRDLWFKALKMLRAGLMPPPKKPRPAPGQRQQIVHWIKRDVFGLDPRNPDPGRVTLRRLNRAEYRNTIRDLLGVDFDALSEFPPDDTGYGFDNIAEVLTLPPILLEKYIAAANRIVAQAVPTTIPVVREEMDKGNPARRPNYERFFPKPVPRDPPARRAYARELLQSFAGNAFRRPPDPATLGRLVNLAESVYAGGNKSFEAGIAQAMVAILASPEFLFRAETVEPGTDKQTFPLIDEYSLASRLSYFFWSSMPDEELLRLAGEGMLRKNLSAQLDRLLKDPRSKAFVENFAGQWLRARDIETIPIEARVVLAREESPSPEAMRRRQRFRELRDKPEDQLTSAEREELAAIRARFRHSQERPVGEELSGKLRYAMRLETERTFAYVLHQDRSLLELLDSDYTFLNERLARHYGITNVSGDEMRLVELPPDSPRGGVLTEGTVLVASSNPTRTSPVKRGVFILDNILGTPVPPPPPNVPPLEAANQGLTNRPPTLRETLAAHRENALCSSCHSRMDPLGLALENFNALGMWRQSEFSQPIDASGRLATGEEFSNFKDLKRLLVENHAEDFYRTLTEKLLMYALGRGLEYYDVETVDQIVDRIKKAGGRSSALWAGIVESAPFQRTRKPSILTASAVPDSAPAEENK